MGEIVSITPELVTTVKDWLDEYKSEMAAALPKYMDPIRMQRVFLTALQRTPKLFGATKYSIVGCFIEAAQLGLEPDGILGHAALIPFNNKKTGKLECQFIPMYKGLSRLATNSGQVLHIEPRAVFEGDTFRWHYGLHPLLEHVPCGESNPAKLTHVYAIARKRDGTDPFVVLTRETIETSHRARSRAKNDGPWVTDYVPMCLKSGIKVLIKYLTLDPNVDRAVTLDDRAEAGLPQQIGPIDVTPQKRKLEVLTEELNGGKGKAKEGTGKDLEWHEGVVTQIEERKERGDKKADTTAVIELKSGEITTVWTNVPELMVLLVGSKGKICRLQAEDKSKEGDEKPFWVLHRIEEIASER